MTSFFRVLAGATLALTALVVTACTSGRGALEKADPIPAEVVTAALKVTEEVRTLLSPDQSFALGIEREEQLGFPNLRRRRLTVFVNSASIDSRGRHTIEILNNNVLLSVAKVVLVEDSETSRSVTLQRILDQPRRFTVERLSRQNFRATDGIVANADAVVWDVPLAGTSNSLEASVLGAALEKASLIGIRFIVLDRPNLMEGDFVDGPLSDLLLAGTLDAFLPLPVVPGTTAAELARLYNDLYGIQGDLTIQPMANWRRSDGNRWLREPRAGLREADLDRLKELRRLHGYRPGWSELQSLRLLLGDGLFDQTSVRVNEDGVAELRAVPRQVPALAVRERLDATPIPSLDVRAVPDEHEHGALIVRTTGLNVVPLTEASLAIRRAAAANPRQLPPDSESVGYRNASLLQSLSRGLEPTAIRRRWAAAPDYLAYMRGREKALLYEP